MNFILSPHCRQLGLDGAKSSALASDRDILARESSANNVSCRWLEGSDVVVTGDAGPVFCEHGSTEGIDFTESDGVHASSLESETESADAGKEVEDMHHPGCESGGKDGKNTGAVASLDIFKKLLW